MSTITSRCPHCEKNNRIPSSRINEEPVCGACKNTLLCGKPVTATQANFKAIINGKKPVVVDFWAPWCGPCKNFAPVFESMAIQKSSKVTFLKVNTEAEQALGAEFNIRSIPTLMLFKNGKVVEQLSGALPQQQFEQWLEQALQR
jgi:thioredoxin 2